jgi:hypothetical protein
MSNKVNIILKDGIWIYFQGPNINNYKIRIGTGGAISNIINNENVELLSPPYKDGNTDKIVQWTIWSSSLKNIVDGLQTYQYRYNVTQGGDMKGVFSPSEYVIVYENGVDVYSTPIDNWRIEQQPYFSGGFSCLTRYRVDSSGILSIRRVILVNKVFLNGILSPLGNTYIEAWTPVSRSVYNALALGISDNNQPNWWYSAGYNIPKYPEIQIDKTNGYSLAYDKNNIINGEVLGLVFGQSNNSVGFKNVFNSMTWTAGFGMLPGTRVYDLIEGDVIDINLFVVLGKGITSRMMNKIEYCNYSIPATRIIKDMNGVDDITKKIIDDLKKLYLYPSKRVDDLTGLDLNYI